jgi:hypothetical protein
VTGDLNGYRDRQGDRFVLSLIGGGIVIIILAVIAALAWATMPDFAESVLSAIVGGSLVKLADVLSALVSLSSNRQLTRVTDQLSESAPGGPQTVQIDQPADKPVPVEPQL